MLWPIAIHVCLTNREREKGIGPFSSCPSFPIPSFSQQEMKTMTNCLSFLMSVSFPPICYQELELMIAIEPFYTHSRLILRNQKQKKTLIVPPSSWFTGLLIRPQPHPNQFKQKVIHNRLARTEGYSRVLLFYRKKIKNHEFLLPTFIRPLLSHSPLSKKHFSKKSRVTNGLHCS